VEIEERYGPGPGRILVRGLWTGTVLGIGAAVAFALLAGAVVVSTGPLDDGTSSAPAAAAVGALLLAVFGIPVGAVAGAVCGVAVAAFARVAGRWLPLVSVPVVVTIWGIPVTLAVLAGGGGVADWAGSALPLAAGVPFGVVHALLLRRWLGAPCRVRSLVPVLR
jgi:hypothetical protein